jgi:replication-associated recombination protein RarA
LQNGVGGVVEDEVEKQVFITNYFMQLFTSNVNGDAQQLLNAVQTRVTLEMNEQLMQEFTDEEIKAALDNIGDLKAPGPDELLSSIKDFGTLWGGRSRMRCWNF